MKHLLCPVPPVHIVAARETAERHGRVAFGSEDFEKVLALEGQEATIWIAASTGYVPPDGVQGVDIGKVILVGRLAGVGWCDARGRPPRPELRPATTADDTIWKVFYEVADVRPLSRPLPTAGLRTEGGGTVRVAPHAIIPIRDPGPARR